MRAPVALAVFAAILAATFGAGSAGSVDVENGVLILNETNFDTALKKFPLLMVSFCKLRYGDCKELLPSYEKAAKKFKKQDPPVRLAKVDASIDSGEILAKRFDVTGYPTVIAFKDGEKHSVFDAPAKEKQEIVQYMQAVAGNPSFFKARAAYIKVRAVWKMALRKVPLLGGSVRKILYVGFPVVVVLCVFLPFFCCKFCCRASAPPKGKIKKKDATEAENEATAGEKADDKKED